MNDISYGALCKIFREQDGKTISYRSKHHAGLNTFVVEASQFLNHEDLLVFF